MEGSTSGILSESTNPDMNTIKEAGIASTSSSNISESENNQQNMAKMEIFMKTWCRFIDYRAKHNARQESFQILYSKLTIEELSDQLNSTHDNLRASKSGIQIAWERIPYKGHLAFILLFLLAVTSGFLLFYGYWQVGLVGLIIVVLSILFLSSRSHSTRFNHSMKDWIYTYYLKLRLKLWKIPPSAPDNDMLNPRCIYVPLNKHQTGNLGEWLSVVILPKLQSELGITDMKELDGTIKNAEGSLNDFQTYSIWLDAVMVSCGNFPLWLFWLLGVVGFLVGIIGGLRHESDIAKVVSFSGIITFIGIIYGFFKSNKENIEPDIEANKNIFDVICRLHRVIKKETIFFAVVANESDDFTFNGMLIEYQRYFKFLINFDDEKKPTKSHPNYTFDMDWLRYNNILDIAKNSLADIIFNCLLNNRFKTDPGNVENTFEFLRLFHKMSNDNNNVSSNRSMLHLVNSAAALTLLKRDPVVLDLKLYILFHGLGQAQISHFDLQEMRLYTVQTMLLIDMLENNASTGRSQMFVYFSKDHEPNM